MLWDLTVNNFTFEGFPEIQVTYDGKVFEVTLRVGEAAVGPFTLDEKTGTDQAKRIDAGGKVSGEFLKTIQGWLFELELAVDKV
jgi:hypothetical protein